MIVKPRAAQFNWSYLRIQLHQGGENVLDRSVAGEFVHEWIAFSFSFHLRALKD
jgi:hypothetical protein